MLAMIEERSFESQASNDSPVMGPSLKNSGLDFLNKGDTSNTSSKKSKHQRTSAPPAYQYDEKRPLVRLNSIDTETPESSSDAESEMRSLRNTNSNNNCTLGQGNTGKLEYREASLTDSRYITQLHNVSESLMEGTLHTGKAVENESLISPSSSTNIPFSMAAEVDDASEAIQELINTSTAIDLVMDDMLKA